MVFFCFSEILIKLHHFPPSFPPSKHFYKSLLVLFQIHGLLFANYCYLHICTSYFYKAPGSSSAWISGNYPIRMCEIFVSFKCQTLELLKCIWSEEPKTGGCRSGDPSAAEHFAALSEDQSLVSNTQIRRLAPRSFQLQGAHTLFWLLLDPHTCTSKPKDTQK